MYNLVVCICFRLLIGRNLATTLLIGTVEIVRDFKLVWNLCQTCVKFVSNSCQTRVKLASKFGWNRPAVQIETYYTLVTEVQNRNGLRSAETGQKYGTKVVEQYCVLTDVRRTIVVSLIFTISIDYQLLVNQTELNRS